MVRSFIFSLLMSLPVSGLAAKDVAEDDAQRLAMYAARGEIVPCRELYDSLQTLAPAVRDSVMPPHVALFCRLAFARAYGNARQVVAVVDSLEQEYESKFDVRGLLALADVRLNAMCGEGLWIDLEEYCRERLKWCARRNIKASRRKPFMQYEALARRFAARPPVSVHWEADSFAVPVSRDWPILLPVSVNDRHEQPFMLHTAQSVSVVSEAGLEEWGIAAPTTEQLSITVQGKSVKARPVVIDSLHIGELTLADVVLYVVDASVMPPYNRVIGTDILRRMPYLMLTDQQAFIRRTPPSSDASGFGDIACGASDMGSRGVETFQLYISLSGRLQTMGSNGISIIDTAFPIHADRPDSLSVRTWDLSCLKRSCAVAFDFQNHRLSLIGNREYRPLVVADYIASDDLFGLLRNEASLLLTASPDEIVALEEALDKALTPPAVDELEEALQRAVIPAGESAVPPVTPRLLLHSRRGLLFEEYDGVQTSTCVLDARNIGSHRIDLKNMLLY